MNTLGRLTTPEQFGDIILKTGSEGQVTRVRDVARIELGAKNRDQSCTLDGKPSVGLAIFQLPGSNALATADRIQAKMDELKQSFPEGLDYAIVYDTTPFISESIHEVVKALRDAFILVAIVVLIFLQSWRATIIPLVAVPVSLVGTFAVMTLLGFSLNNLSLLGLVLAIGIVVDDAIVVVENVRAVDRAGPVAEGGRLQVDGRGDGRGHRHRLRPERGVHPGRVHRGHHRPVLPPVRPDHRDLDAHLGVQLADAEPGPGGDHPQAEGPGRPRPCTAMPCPGSGSSCCSGLIAYLKLTPYLAPLFGVGAGHGEGGHGEAVAMTGNPAMIWAARAAAFAVGCVAGWLLAGLVNRLLAGFFKRLQRGLRLADGRLCPDRPAGASGCR